MSSCIFEQKDTFCDGRRYNSLCWLNRKSSQIKTSIHMPRSLVSSLPKCTICLLSPVLEECNCWSIQKSKTLSCWTSCPKCWRKTFPRSFDGKRQTGRECLGPHWFHWRRFGGWGGRTSKLECELNQKWWHWRNFSDMKESWPASKLGWILH